MRRKNLFLSLISSVLVAVAIVTVTICSVIKPKSNKSNNSSPVSPISDVTEEDEKDYDLINEYERNGSAEYPYIIYSTDSFNKLLSQYGSSKRVVTEIVKTTTEVEGKLVEVNKLDEQGHIIFKEVFDKDGNKMYDVNHFEFANDIDFNGIEYNTLFNDGSSFIGVLDGKDFTLKNVSINVRNSNLESKFAYSCEDMRNSHIALFGNINGAKIKNMKISGLNVNVASEVYDFVSGAKYSKVGGAFREIVVGSIAGVAVDSTIENVTLNANVEGFSYILSGSASRNNSLGGVVGVAENLTIKDSKIDVSIKTNAGKDYLVGGVAGYGRVATVLNVELSVGIESTYSEKLIMAGMFAYGKNLSIKNSSVEFKVNEMANADARDAYVKEITDKETVDLGGETLIAGLVAIIRANDSTQKSEISNVSINSKVDFDAVFAGVVLDVYSDSQTTYGLVKFNNVRVFSEVKALAIHGFARQLVASTVSYDEVTSSSYVNIKIKGSAIVEKYIDGVEYKGVTLFVASKVNYYKATFEDLYFEVSNKVNSQMSNIDKLRVNNNVFGKYEIIAA